MDAIQLLNQHIDVEKLLNHYDFDKIRNDGNMMRCCCKLHGGNNPTAFVINRENGLWFCHTGDCGGGDAYSLVMHMEQCDFFRAVQFLADMFHVDIANLKIVERKEAYMSEMKKWIDMMRRRQKKRVVDTWNVSCPVREVTKFRNFEESTMKHFGLGFVESVELENRNGDMYTLKNRLMFPIVQNGLQIGCSFRRIKSSDMLKWLHAPTKIETKELLYNYDALQCRDVGADAPVVVVEGILDVWAFHEIGALAVATFGAHVSDEQYRLLIKCGRDIVFAFDGDDAGRSAQSRAIERFRMKANLFSISFSDGQDPESVSREELQTLYAHRVRV